MTAAGATVTPGLGTMLVMPWSDIVRVILFVCAAWATGNTVATIRLYARTYRSARRTAHDLGAVFTWHGFPPGSIALVTASYLGLVWTSVLAIANAVGTHLSWFAVGFGMSYVCGALAFRAALPFAPRQNPHLPRRVRAAMRRGTAPGGGGSSRMDLSGIAPIADGRVDGDNG